MLTLFRNFFAPPRHMILLVIAAWIGLTLSEKRAERHGISRDDLNNIAFYGLIAFIVGGRLAYVLENLPAFTKSPLGILSINPDLFDPLGALAIAVIVGVIHGQRRGLAPWPTLDSLTLFFATLAVGLGLSHLAAGTAFGKETGLPWGIDLWNAYRHPTQIYETIASLLTLVLLWFKRPGPRPGMDFLTFAALTSASQLFIQGFRGDSTLIAGGCRQEQIAAWIALASCFVLFETLLRRKSKNG
jgi:phosphatidylglycerol:prolipoprotein diacylglycerol transferase